MTHENMFGMFIHWGIYSLTELQEQAFARYDLPREKYEALALQFNPIHYDPEQWVLLAMRAGMKYICFTAKHHDGFCMWNTQYTDYCIMNTPYGKDVLKMLADACHKHGMRLSIYYSNPDWHHPKGYNPASSHQWKAVDAAHPDMEVYKTYIKNQLSELLSNYGDIYTLFWDIPPQIEDKSINDYARSLQPNILINNRGFDPGDFATPEREIGLAEDSRRFIRMTEACDSIDTQSWGYRKEADFYSTRYLCSSIDAVMARGDNYLLNIGPMSDGSLHPEHVDRINRVGNWYQRMKGCLENHEADPFDYQICADCKWIAARKNQKTYFHFPNGINSTAVAIAKYPSIPRSVRLMNTGAELPFAVKTLPGYFSGTTGRAEQSYLYIRNIPVDDIPNEPIVLEVDWDE